MEPHDKISAGSVTLHVDEETAGGGHHADKTSPDLQVDGGYRAWSALIGGFLVSFVVFGYSNAFGVYQDIYTRSHAASASNVSWIGSTQIFLLFTVGLPAGKWLDKGYFKRTNLIGSFIYVFSMFMVSLAHPDKYYQVWLSQGLGLGIGSGLLYVPAVAVQNHHWKERRSFAMSAVVSGSSIGGIIFPIMLNQLFKGSVGFAWGVRASAFLCLALLIPANLLLNDNPSIKHQAEKPSLKAIVADVPYVISVFGVLFITLGIFFVYFYLQLFAVLHGVDPNVAFYTLSVMNAAGIFGRSVPGILADRYGPFNVIVPSIFANAVLIFALLGIKSTASIMVFAVLFGLSSGAFLTLCPPCNASLSRHPNEMGTRFGISFFFTGFGALAGAPIGGALLGDTFPWWRPIVLCGVLVSAGFLCVATTRYMLTVRRNTQWV